MKFKGIFRNNYTERWDEALPIGNGTIGALLLGNPIDEKIITNHEELFLPLPENADSRCFMGRDRLEKTRSLIREGKSKEAVEYYIKGLEADGAPKNTTIWTNPFETAAEINVSFTDFKYDDITEYSQSLNFETGEANISYNVKGENVTRRAFASKSREIVALEIRKDGNPFSVKVSMSPNRDYKLMESISSYAEDDCIYINATHSEACSGYVAVTRVITDGVSETFKDYIAVSKANYVLLYYTLSPWSDRMEALKVKLARKLMDMTPDYEALEKENEAIYSDLFNRVKVSFSDSECKYSNNELKAMCKQETLVPELLERMADFGRYLEISSFGKLPPNLQGVWNGEVNPPWCSDYTLDENVQMMMWQVLPGGLEDYTKRYFDWLESYVADFKENAANLYGCNGILGACRASTDGYSRHFSEGWPMVMWTAAAGWLAREYQEYYEFTGDESVLERGVKFNREIVKFYEDFMVVGEDGKYEFIPSYSPENTPLGSDSPVAINATMDISVAKEVYTNLINACKILNIEAENIPVWEREYAMLPDYTVNEDGALKEWIPKQYPDDYHHRHSSHLYMVFPGREALNPGNEKLLEACHKACKLRLIDGVDAISGWGLAHLANISARLSDSGLWYSALSRLIRIFTLDNLFTGHNEHSLFQMDANLGITNAVYEMFAYSKPGLVKLFPVLHDRLLYAQIEGLCLRGNGKILCLKRDGDEIFAKITNNGNCKMKVLYPDGFSDESGKSEIVILPGDTYTINAFKR